MESASKTLVADGTPVVGGNYPVLRHRKLMEQKYLEKALPQMEGETPQVVFRGVWRMSPWLLLPPLTVLFFLPYALLASGRMSMVVVTNRCVHIFSGSISVSDQTWRKKPVTLNRPTDVKLTRWGLKLGNEKKLYAYPGTSGAMRAAAALAQQRPTR